MIEYGCTWLLHSSPQLFYAARSHISGLIDVFCCRWLCALWFFHPEPPQRASTAQSRPTSHRNTSSSTRPNVKLSQGCQLVVTWALLCPPHFDISYFHRIWMTLCFSLHVSCLLYCYYAPIYSHAVFFNISMLCLACSQFTAHRHTQHVIWSWSYLLIYNLQQGFNTKYSHPAWSRTYWII